MISRRGFTVAGLGVSAMLLVALVPPVGKVYRIGWLAPAPVPSNLQAFRDGMRALGYAEGNNLVIVQRYAIGAEPLAGLAAELVATGVDVFMSSSRASAEAAKNTAGSTSVVFVTGNPVETGLVVSLARPGGKLTGLSLINAGLDAKRLQLLKEFVPKVSRVGVLMGLQPLRLAIAEVEAAARSLGLEIVRLEVRGADGIEPGSVAIAAYGPARLCGRPRIKRPASRTVKLRTKR
jgi:putative ABC transport system substrate-binding protein